MYRPISEATGQGICVNHNHTHENASGSLSVGIETYDGERYVVVMAGECRIARFELAQLPVQQMRQAWD